MFFSTAYVFYGSFMSSPRLFYSLWNEKRERVDMQYLRHLKKIQHHKTVKKLHVQYVDRFKDYCYELR